MSEDNGNNGNGDGVYRITVRTVYEAVQEIRTTMGEIKASVDQSNALTKLVNGEQARTVEDHEQRLRTLESRPWISWKQIAGGATGVAVIVGAFYPVFHK